MGVILQGESMLDPTTVIETEWGISPPDQNVVWLVGTAFSPSSYVVVGKPISGTTGSDVKLTGMGMLDIEGNTPPDLPILGRGGDYEITFGMYNKQFGLLTSESTEGLLKNTLLVGAPMLDPLS